MAKRSIKNRLNDLDSKSWLKFQKSWFIHNPPPRRKNTLRHPAKFPETMITDFIQFFTKTGEFILDPMAGTGSALVAAISSGRSCIGIELNPDYAKIAGERVTESLNSLKGNFPSISAFVHNNDAGNLLKIFEENQYPEVDYVITSPPYWNMLHEKGAQTQSSRKADVELDVIYSTNDSDLGNIDDYDTFLTRLVRIYENMKPILREKAYITIIVKNIKKGGKIYPLAWDIGQRLGEVYQLKDEKIWCQDNIKLAPYGYGSAWVSNTFHHYCLQFRND
jgi:DNA modification methylase